jgi:hypothetical protein
MKKPKHKRAGRRKKKKKFLSSFFFAATKLTQNGEQTQKNDCERSHAQSKNLFFLHQFAVVAGKA